MTTLPDTRQAASSSTANEEPTLRSVTASSGYVFPAIWSFPPFFTYVASPLPALSADPTV